jgi:hypothetical protein
MGISEPAAIRIERVTNRKALKTFVGLPAPLYRDDPVWVAPLMFERLNLLAKDKNPYFEHAAADYWIAYRDGEPVGRISAQIDELAQRGHGQGTGHFGFVEAPDDPAVFRALFETAEAWLRGRGMVRVLGPFNLSINEECGLLIDGFEDRPRIMTSHARPYYAARIEGLGYRKAKDLWAYDLDAVAELPKNVLRIVRKAEAHHRLQVRNLRRKRMSDDFEIIRDIFNDAWSNNWGYVPFTEAEIAKMRADLRPLLYEHSGKIAYWDGEPAAFMLVLPDLNELIADLHGRLAPFGWAKLAWRVLRRRFPCVRVPLMGVRKRYQHRSPGAFMALLLIEQHRVEWRRRHGLVRGELSWILEDNESMKGIADSIVGVHYKTYRIYEKALR